MGGNGFENWDQISCSHKNFYWVRWSLGHKIIKSFNLISTKPKIFICNLNEKENLENNKYINLIIDNLNDKDASVISISAEIESQISQLENENEKKEFLNSLEWENSGLERIIKL